MQSLSTFFSIQLTVLMIARSAARIARPVLRVSERSAAQATTVRSTRHVRGYASMPTPPKSDLPWAVTSALVFGGLFIYVTSPSKGDSHGHDSHGSKHAEHEEDSADDEEPEAREPVEHPNGNIEHPEGFVEVKRPDMRDDAPEGDKHIDSRSVSDEHAFEKQSKTKREPPAPHDNTTFQHGLAASKDGNPISDPKKVVASAKTHKEEKAKSKAGENVDANANEGKQGKDESSEGKDDD